MTNNDYYIEFKKLEVYIKEELNFEVENFASDLDDDTLGRIHYNERLIKINCSNAKEGLFTLIHEGGHCVSYLKYYKKLNQPQSSVKGKEELYAYLYGWYLIKKLNIPISKEEWRREECMLRPELDILLKKLYLEEIENKSNGKHKN